MRVIAGSAKHFNLKTPKGNDIRPTTDKIKETLFNILMPYIYDCKFLDLFAGSGAIGIEALSRGAKKAVFAENNKAAVKCINENLNHTNLSERGEVFCIDVISLIKTHIKNDKYDIIFIDPPYFEEYYKPTLEAIRNSDILEKDGMVILECNKKDKDNFYDINGFEVFRIKDYGNIAHIFLKGA